MSVDRVRRWGTGVFLSGGAVVAAAMLGIGAAHADDGVGTAGATAALTASSGNQFDPAVVPYSPDPSNLFAPVYTIAPVGPEEGVSTVTDPNNPDTTDTFGTQDFSVSSLGFPVDTFTAQSVEYTPTPFDEATGLSGIVSQLSQELGFGGGYAEEIGTLGSAGTLLPEPTEFLVSEFGFGYGNVFEESMNTAGTSLTVGDFVLTPFGDVNITPIVDLFLPPGITDAGGTADPSGFADLASSIGL
jgi:hypothetical protein